MKWWEVDEAKLVDEMVQRLLHVDVVVAGSDMKARAADHDRRVGLTSMTIWSLRKIQCGRGSEGAVGNGYERWWDGMEASCSREIGLAAEAKAVEPLELASQPRTSEEEDAKQTEESDRKRFTVDRGLGA